MNRLQSLRADRRFLVTLNRSEAIDPAQVIERFEYAHPDVHARRRRRAAPLGRDQRPRPHPLLRGLLALGLPRGRRLVGAARLGVARRTRADRRKRPEGPLPSVAAGARGGGAGGMSRASAVYEGWVIHRRRRPVEHEFRYRVFMPLLRPRRAARGPRPVPALVGSPAGAGVVSPCRLPRRREQADRRSRPRAQLGARRTAAGRADQAARPPPVPRGRVQPRELPVLPPRSRESSTP